jgi:hypothetical protein
MEVKLDNALTEQGRHATTLDRHDGRIRGVEDRVTSLEAVKPLTHEDVRAVVESSKPKNVATWAGVAVAVIAVAVAFAALFVQ